MDRPRHPFAYRDYRRFWVARLCSTLAQTSMVVVIGWQVYDVARRTMNPRGAALQLGLIGLAQFLPLLLLTPITGWVADHVDRRIVARSTFALQVGCAGVLALLTAGSGPSLAVLFAVAAVLGVARAFSQPAINALGPNLVPRGALPRAIAMNSIAGRAGGIVGPAAGGFLYAAGPHLPYVVSAGLLGVSLGCMVLIAPVERALPGARRHPLRQIAEGLHFIRGNQLVLGAISLDLFAVLLGGATALLPVFARDILHVGPDGLGQLRAAPAVGAMATALWFGYRPLRRGVRVKMLAAVAIFGAATIGFGLSRSMPLSLACLTLLGASDMLSVYVRQSLIQLSTPDAMRGRVGAVSTLFVSASNELGEAESGFLAALIGPVAAVIVGGMGAIAVTAIWARWFPALRLAGTLDVAEPAEPRVRQPG